MRNKYLPIAIVLMAGSILTGCEVTTSGPRTSVGVTATADGKTEGSSNINSKDKGEASYDVDGDKVNLTNISFTTSYKIDADIVEDGLVHTNVILHDDEKLYFGIMDGKYTEDFAIEKSKDQYNDLYQKLYGATDSPFTANLDQMEEFYAGDDMMAACVSFSSSNANIYVNTGSNEYVVIEYTQEDPETFNYLEQQVIDAFGGNVPKSVIDTLTADPSAETSDKTDYGEMYVINIAGKNVGLDNFGQWQVVQTSEYLISIYPKEGTEVSYMDSYAKVGDTSVLDKEAETIYTLYDTEPELYSLNTDNGTEYVITWFDGKYERAEYFQILAGVDNYMETDIKTDDTKTDILDLVDLYSIEF